MKLFKRKKDKGTPARHLTCPHCGSNATFASVHDGGDTPVSVKTWRGRSYIERRCRDCGRIFYVDIREPNRDAELSDTDEDTNDEEALELAEEELKRRTDAEGDHRYPSH